MPTSDSSTLDIQKLLKAIKYNACNRNKVSQNLDRVKYSQPVNIVKKGITALQPESLGNCLYIDGIQKSLTLQYVDSRAIVLQYSAAAAVKGNGEPVKFNEKLIIRHSATDQPLIDRYQTNIDSEQVLGMEPPTIESDMHTALCNDRIFAEKSIINDILGNSSTDSIYVCVDGSIPFEVNSDKVFGVIKTTDRVYLPSENELYSLKPGEISSIFKISQSQRISGEIFSCYLKVAGGGDQNWNYGLIRIEALRDDILIKYASHILTLVQKYNDRDFRVDRQIRPIWLCEEFLKARAPRVFSAI